MQTAPFPYRRDIDGLRAIAVSAVVLYHFGVSGVDGGFVGVDIFFVISGFLIGRLLWQEQEETGRIALIAFFARRLKRLAPAFTVMVVGTTLAAWFILLPFEFREFGKQIIAATLYLANLLFWRDAGYFDTVSAEKPLLHTWSLSLEEQFYIVLPLLLIALFRLKPSLRLAALWLIALASLAGCILTTPSDQTSTFFLLHFRAWELLAGTLLAIHLSRGWVPQSPLVLSSAGLVLLVYAITTTPAGAQFPGHLAIAPVLGTVLLIAGGTQDHIITQALSLKIPVAIGLISYSLYLWHWPVFVLSSYALGGLSSIEETATAIAASLGLAALSWRFVERPFRRSRVDNATMFDLVGAASAATLACAFLIFKLDGLPGRFNGEVRTHIDASADFLQDFSRCTIAEDGPLKGLEICPIGPEGTPTFLAWGDSHLRAFKEGIDQAAWEAERPGLLIWRAGCPPLFGVRKRESYATPAQDAACTRANLQIEEALPELGLKDILLVGRWSYYAHGTGIGLDAENTIHLNAPFDRLARKTLEAIGQMDIDLHILRQPPEVPTYDSRDMARALAHGRRSSDDALTLSTIDRALAEERAALAETPLKEAIETANGTWIDPWPSLCTETLCRALPHGRPFYFDNNHVTNLGARTLRYLFIPALIE